MEPSGDQPEIETHGQVVDSGGVTWTQYAYGIWKPDSLPPGVRRISAAGFKTIEAFYGPLTWIKPNQEG
jgi:hypothetical protein